MAEAVFSGGCLCGAVRYRAAGPMRGASICHCSMCRKAGGAPYMAFVTVQRAHIGYEGAEPTLYRSSDIASRGFCARCGTALTWESDRSRDEVDLAIATLDDPAAIPPLDQIFTADAVGWAQDLTGLPGHPRERGDGPA